jgi:hypothetical protein
VRTGLLVSEQGTHGGYRLSRPANEITALEAIRAIDGPIILTHCFTEHSECDQSNLCPVREPLRKVHEEFCGFSRRSAFPICCRTICRFRLCITWRFNPLEQEHCQEPNDETTYLHG